MMKKKFKGKSNRLLIIVEGSDAAKPDPSFFDKVKPEKIYLLYLSPSVKASFYRRELQLCISTIPDIKIIDHKRFVDFAKVRKELIDFIVSMPDKFKISNFRLNEYLIVKGLNMWWASGVVEATAYKRKLLQNLYYLYGISRITKEFNIDTVWFSVDDAALSKDAGSFFGKHNIEYYSKRKRICRLGVLTCIRNSGLFIWASSFATRLAYSILFRLFCPWLSIPQPSSSGRFIHLFWTSYPQEVRFNGDFTEAKTYEDLPSVLSEKLGGQAYFLSYISHESVFSIHRLLRSIKKIWKGGFRLLPMDRFVSARELCSIFFSPVGLWKYLRLRQTPCYRKTLAISGIDLFHTFDNTIKHSLFGNEARLNLFYYLVFRNFVRSYGENIFQVTYPLEFHNWEEALISGVKSVKPKIPVIGLQQSAPNPILLGFFLPRSSSACEDNCYQLPDLILCAGELYRDILISNGISHKRVIVVGHMGWNYLNINKESMIEHRKNKRIKYGFSIDKKICLVACSIDASLTDGIIYILRDVVNKLQEVIFVFKAHPNFPRLAADLLHKYGMYNLPNIRVTQHSVSEILPISDYFVSTSTSVSREALRLGIPQVNLDVGGLPKTSPLHLVPGLIRDASSAEDLIEFFLNPKEFKASEEKTRAFIDHQDKNPYEKFMGIVTERFYN